MSAACAGLISLISLAAASLFIALMSSRCTRGSTSSRVSDACSGSSSLKMAMRCWLSSSSRMSARSTGWMSCSFSFSTFSLTLPEKLPICSGRGWTYIHDTVAISLCSTMKFANFFSPSRRSRR